MALYPTPRACRRYLWCLYGAWLLVMAHFELAVLLVPSEAARLLLVRVLLVPY